MWSLKSSQKPFVAKRKLKIQVEAWAFDKVYVAKNAEAAGPIQLCHPVSAIYQVYSVQVQKTTVNIILTDFLR